ncbi:MAG: glycosyltransferase family 39 protein, partial [Candidatus Promineifilaceae bacterium]
AGQFPYRDVWHPKGFLSFVPYVIVTAVFGHQMWGIRLFDLVWQFGSGLLIFQIGRQRMGNRGAVLAVGLFYLIYYNFGYWHIAQPEGFQIPVLLLSVWLYDRASQVKRPYRYLFASGFVIALAPWFKQTAVVFIAALLLWAIYEHRPTNQRADRSVAGHQLVKTIGALFAGLTLANGLVLVFTAVTGMLAPMLEAFNFAFVDYPNQAHAGLLEMVPLTVNWGVWFPALIFPFLAGLCYLTGNRPLSPRWLGIMLMALAGLAAVYIQRHLWLYQLDSTLPFMALISAYAIEGSFVFLQALTNKRQKQIVWLFGFVLLSLVLPPINRIISYDTFILKYLTGQTPRAEFLEEYELLDVVDTAEYLTQHTAEDDPIFVWGHYAMLYYLANRPDPTRFINDPPLSIPNSHQTAWREEAMIDLTADPPVYIIVATDDDTDFEPQTTQEQLADFPALNAFLNGRYRLETTIGALELYRIVE